MSPADPGNIDRSRPGRRAGRRKRWIALTVFLFAGVSLLITYFFLSSRAPAPLPGTVPPSPPKEEAPPSREARYHTVEGSVRERSTLFNSLAEQKIPLSSIDLIVSKLGPHVNFRKIKGGRYRLVNDETGELVRFTYEAGPAEIYEIERTPQGVTVQRKDVTLDTYLVKVVGEIRSSLFEAVEEAGEQDRLVLAFAEILAWEIDFYKDVKEGDRFKMVVEKTYKGDQWVAYGPIHVVEYRRGEKAIRGIAYNGDFYSDQGTSLRKAFLKTPLRFSRISSRFSQARRHPILGGVVPHFGVDYAAPIGTPVWAVADGTVVSCGWSGGFGKQVVLRHANGYMTYYAHLSSYGPGVRKGTQVRQQQVIGYVGSTGLSTGPHLDYRLAKDRRFRNPLRETFPAGIPLRPTERAAFEMRKEQMVQWLEGNAPFRRKRAEIDEPS